MEFSTLEILFQIIAFLFAISLHESAHAWSALRLGDDTASLLGRISLNPIRHIDPFGTLLLPAFLAFVGAPLFGWAKPTPVNTLRLKNRVRDNVLVSAAGPASNLLVVAGALLLLLLLRSVSPEAGRAVLAVAGFGPIALGGSVMTPLVLLLYAFLIINVILAIFNLIPIPPLDGSHVLAGILPDGIRQAYESVGQYGTLLLFALLWGTNLFGRIISPVLNFCDSLLMIGMT